MGDRRWRLGALLAAVTLMAAFGTAALGAGGQSTPGAIVSAQNAGDLRLTLVALSERGEVTDPSCRPQDATIRCWGSLVLDAPGGLSVRGIEVHRLAIGDTSCGGDDEGGDECGGHAATGAILPDEPVHAAVRGVATLGDPGDTGMAAGIRVQVFIDLVDGGAAEDADLAQVRVRPWVEGPVKPDWAYDTGSQSIRQVQIRTPGPNG